MADLAPDRVAGLHQNFLASRRPRPRGPAAEESLTAEDQARIQAMRRRRQDAETGYSAIQAPVPGSRGEIAGAYG